MSSGSRPVTQPSALYAVVLLALAACSGSGGGTSSAGAGNAELIAVHHGRLVDVYGYREVGGLLTFDLYRTDVLVGSDIRDERQPGDGLLDEDIIYDFISPHPDTLQARLFIPRDMASVDFRLAFERLDNGTRAVAPAQFSPIGGTQFSVVARNAAFRLTFAGDLGIDDEFFVERDAAGHIVGVRNAEAVQLLEIVGDPTDGFDGGDFRVVPTRVSFARDAAGNITQPHQIVVDPVLLGAEGVEYLTRNNASGMPEAPDQAGANVRLAVALEGPLAIPGVREDSFGDLTGKNNAGRLAVIRDLRAGNRRDDSADISRGFLRDPIAPRIVGSIPFLLERVDELDEISQEITIFKNGLIHAIDRGDVLRLVDPAGTAETVTEVIAAPEDDRGLPGVQHVRVRVRRVPPVLDDRGQLVDPIEALDPSDDPGYPQDPAELDGWLARNAPTAILSAEFTASRTEEDTGNEVRDDPRYFITFTPEPLPEADGTRSNPGENVSPFASAIIRFTKPVSLDTVKTTDTFFLATRNLLQEDKVAEFRQAGGRGPGSAEIQEGAFRIDKFRTPHLIASRVFDEDGSQTILRLQPILGLYLDDVLREDDGRPFRDKQYKYFLQLLGGDSGITDLSGNPLEFLGQSAEDNARIVIPFSLDTRMRSSVDPVFPNNIVASVVRTYNDPDEDEQPSYYQNDEVQPAGESVPVARAQGMPDVFGAVTYLDDGILLARPTSRIRQTVDDLNQREPPLQSTDFRWCPERFTTFGYARLERQVPTRSAAIAFNGGGIQNPLNPYGSRLQTVWREIDMSLSRTDPADFNLDVEQMYWAPFTGSPIRFDEFDRVSMFLGHSEKRPEPCVGSVSALPTLPNSGLQPAFADNFVHNNLPANWLYPRKDTTAPPPHPAYVDVEMQINPAQAITEVNGLYRYLPLPTFQKPYFVWRDERVIEQGGATETGTDADPSGFEIGRDPFDYIPSPFLGGHGRKLTAGAGGSLDVYQATWTNAKNYPLAGSFPDNRTGGLVGSIALPLLADFWTYCDSATLPPGNGFIAAGTNGWQVSLAVQSNHLPAFRAYSGGFAGFGAKPAICVDPNTSQWLQASGGYDLGGNLVMGGTRGNVFPITGDNSVYWIMADFLKRMTVVTSGFVDITNPHRMPADWTLDPRLGPYRDLPPDALPSFTHAFEPPQEELPAGTAVAVEYRGASSVDPDPWRPRWDYDSYQALITGSRPPWNLPAADNFALDPLKAGDAHIRKFDERSTDFSGGRPRNWWTYLYNRTVTRYTDDANTLMSPEFADEYSEPLRDFAPEDVRYFNWRFVMTNNVDANPPISPSIDTFMVVYRFEQTR